MKLFKRRSKTGRDTELADAKADLACENMIMKEKARFGRVRPAVMRYLRAKYGEAPANRAMWRINTRISKGIFTGEDRTEEEKKYMKTAKRLRPISEIAKEEAEEEKIQKFL